MTNKATPRSCTSLRSIGISTKYVCQSISPANLASDRNQRGGKLSKKILTILNFSTFPRIQPNSQNPAKIIKKIAKREIKTPKHTFPPNLYYPIDPAPF